MHSRFKTRVRLVAGLVLASAAYSFADDRLPIPSATEIVAAEAQIKDLYKDDLAKPKPSDKAALGRQMLKQAEDTKSDMAGRYELFRYARTLAGKGGDVPTAMDAADHLSDEFQVKPGETHFAVVELVQGAPMTVAASQEAAESFGAAAERAVISDEYDAAIALAKAAEAAARRTQNLPTISASAQRVRWATSLKGEADKLKSSFAALDKDPKDATANFLVGRFTCYIKNDWEHGLGYLGLGSDTLLRDTAMRDMASATGSGADKLAAADAWYGIATNADATAKPFIQMHAYALYSDAAGDLEGLEKAKAEHRITELQKVVDAHSNYSKLWPGIRKGLAGNLVKKWDFIGGVFARKEVDEIPPAGAVLIGFNYMAKNNGGFPAVIQAIYLTPSGESTGRVYGRPDATSKPLTAKAKSGYAVGAIYVRGGGGFDAFQPVFMRMATDGLKTADTYPGPYTGGQGGGDGVVGDGNFIIGLHLKLGDDGAVYSLSVVTLTNLPPVTLERPARGNKGFGP